MSVDVPVDPALVDLEALRGWMDARGVGSGPLEDIGVLSGGTQNVLVRFRRDGRDLVLRRPPLHKRANSDETMRREARVLEALRTSDVPHPTFVAGEPDPELLGAAFYLMEAVPGVNPTVELPATHRAAPENQRRLGFAMVDALAALARIEPASVGLGDLGRTEGWVERQVDRWARQLDGYLELDGYAEVEIDHVARVGRWLAEHQPRSMQPGLIHGDFHFANVLVSEREPALTAVVDWELATLGDPLLDLGHLLACWPGVLPSSLDVDAQWLPSVDDLVSHYATSTDRPLDDLRWYRTLACYRLGIILEGTHARARSGLASTETGDSLHAMACDLLELAARLVDGTADDGQRPASAEV